MLFRSLADWSNEIPTLELDELAESAAVEFLLERTHDKRRRLPTDAADAQALAGELGRLALALEQAGAFIAQKRSSLADYLTRWRRRDEAVQQWNDERLTKYPHAVVTTWDTTVEQLSPEGRSLLRQLSWLAPEPIPRSLLPNGPTQDALAELASFSLAKFEEGGGRFRIHRLVQDVTRERQSGEEKDLSLRSMLEIFNKAECGDPQDVRSWPVWDPLRPHLSAVTTYADQYDIAEPTTRLMNQLGVFLLTKASYEDAEPLMKQALAIDEASFGPNHPNVARDLNNLASLLQATNRIEDAEPLMKRALAIDEASHGPDHPRVARDLNNLAMLLQDTNRLEEAEPLMTRTLAIDEASYGPNHPRVAIDLSNLATLLQSTNRLTESELLMRRTLAIDEASYEVDHPTLAIGLNNLAVLLKNTSRLAEAEPLMCRQLVILLRFTRSTEHPHPHLKQAGENYLALLRTMGLSEEEISRRLLSLGEDAGFDAGTYRPLLAELLR